MSKEPEDNDEEEEVEKDDDAKLRDAMFELDRLYNEALDAEAAGDEVYDRIMKAVTEAAMEIYPELKEMEPDQIRQFGDCMSTHVMHITEDLDRLSTWVEYPERFDKNGQLKPYKSKD